MLFRESRQAAAGGRRLRERRPHAGHVGADRDAERAFLERWREPRLAEGEDYYAYRDALREDAALEPLVAEADRRFAEEHPGITAPAAFHREALRVAGFSTADEIWRHLADAILVAVR